jgi:hypothetical protein
LSAPHVKNSGDPVEMLVELGPHQVLADDVA